MATRVPEDEPNDVAELRARLTEAEETLRAIHEGEVDALLVVDAQGERVYTLRGADAPYRALIEQMQEGAVTLSARGDVMYCNRRFAEMVGRPLEQVIGAALRQFVDAEDQASLEALIAAGTGSRRSRLRSLSAGWLDAHFSVSTLTLDGVEHRTLIVTDLSILSRAERENRSKDEFLAMLAHELRNPLGAIEGAVQVLQLVNSQEPRTVRANSVIHRQVRHMARLVDDLLDVGRVVTGKIALDRHPLDLAASVRAHVAGLAPEGTAPPVEVTTEPVWVLADPVRLEQIVGNLISNAVKFSPPGEPVRVSVKAQGHDAVLTVSDRGAGIPAELLPTIFDLFVQADDTRSRSKGGLGIGLTLVRRLVDLHGGVVDARSDGPGRGATFTVRLPAAAVGRTLVRAPALPERPAAKTVFLIDDNADSREMYRMVLEADGHRVYEAGDGAGALALFRESTPDVAIIDIGLPDMDGYELARTIRAGAPGAGVSLIALTGYGFPEDRQRSHEAGFDRHLVKPIEPAELRAEIEGAIAARQR
jgi:PAS domain S-box-containing protein